MKINVMRKGDRVINVTAEFVAIERKNGEVDLIPIRSDETGAWIDRENIITIGYGKGIIETKLENGVVITDF